MASGTTAYTWDAATNRTSAGSSPTAYDAADRPTSGTSPIASYSSDADGRLTARPGQAMICGRGAPASRKPRKARSRRLKPCL